jgi:Tfp pilus assembly protein PilF
LSKRAGYTIPIPEVTANLIGYRLLQANRVADAVEVFKANAQAYPASANVFDSLGEAYEKQGSLDLARESYERAARVGKENGDPNTAVYEQNRNRLTANR